jgi:hypothetical protein
VSLGCSGLSWLHLLVLLFALSTIPCMLFAYDPFLSIPVLRAIGLAAAEARAALTTSTAPTSAHPISAPALVGLIVASAPAPKPSRLPAWREWPTTTTRHASPTDRQAGFRVVGSMLVSVE